MSAPANIRVNTSVPFPALTMGSGPISVTKVNGVWTIGFSINALQAQTPPLVNFPTDFLLFYDTLANTSYKLSFTSLLQMLGTTPVQNFDTVAGTYNVTSETILLINKTVPAAHNIQLPAASGRGGTAIVIKDYAGNAAANVATILPNGSEKIDGLSSVPINTNYGGFRLVPIATGGWFISP